MKSNILITGLIVIYLLFSPCFLSCNVLKAQVPGSAPVLSADDLKEWIGYLASDEMKGRASGSEEIEAVAKWLAGRYKEYGLSPLPGHNGYIHEYSFETRSGKKVNERNVIGFLEGNDPELKNEFILITAHFDHVGTGRPVEGDSIYNGADDNAAGTCTLLGIAGSIHRLKAETGRSIIFATVSGEEMGLRGSGHIAANPPFRLEDVYANINFEMTGHSEFLGRNNYYMTGCKLSNLDDIINEYNKETEYKLIDTIMAEGRLFYMSDNYSFANIRTENDITYGIPCGTFATTTFADYIHSPSDEAGLFDFENMAGLVNYFTGMIIYLSNTGMVADWTDEQFRRLR